MGFSIWHLLVVVLVIVLLFGTKRLPQTMEDIGRGINAFKKGLKQDDGGKDKLSGPAPKDLPKE